MTERLLTFQFGQPWSLLLLALVPLRAWLQGHPGEAVAQPYSSVAMIRNIGSRGRRRPGHWHRLLENVAFALLIIAMACPRRDKGNSSDNREGVDIVFAVDVSGSMGGGVNYQNKTISKEEALRLAIDDFVDKRPPKRYVKDEYGREIHSRAEERTLREIADAAGGRYYSFTPGSETFQTLQQQSLLPLARRGRDQHLDVPDYFEWFQFPLDCAIFFMAAGSATRCSDEKPPRRPWACPCYRPKTILLPLRTCV